MSRTLCVCQWSVLALWMVGIIVWAAGGEQFALAKILPCPLPPGDVGQGHLLTLRAFFRDVKEALRVNEKRPGTLDGWNRHLGGGGESISPSRNFLHVGHCRGMLAKGTFLPWERMSTMSTTN